MLKKKKKGQSSVTIAKQSFVFLFSFCKGKNVINLIPDVKKHGKMDGSQFMMTIHLKQFYNTQYTHSTHTHTHTHTQMCTHNIHTCTYTHTCAHTTHTCALTQNTHAHTHTTHTYTHTRMHSTPYENSHCRKAIQTSHPLKFTHDLEP